MSRLLAAFLLAVLPLAVLSLAVLSLAAPAVADTATGGTATAGTATAGTVAGEEAGAVRFAVFNIWELSEAKIDQLDAEGRGVHPQLLAAAEVIRRVRPDVLLLNEIDHHPSRSLARLFVERYLLTARAGLEPIDYPHLFDAPVNTGVPSLLDLDNDGTTDGPADAWGFGRYPGQYGMALLSRFEIDRGAARTFRAQRWIAMPGHLIPDGRGGRPDFYSEEEAAVLRLSSKSHWDVPIRLPESLGGGSIHVLASHPTPPVFDGEEDHNGRRNYDEIRLFADYLHGGERAAWLVDDRGQRGGLPRGEAAVVMGDLNSDPLLGDAAYGRPAIVQLLEHPRLRDPRPRGDGQLPQDPERPPYPGDRRTLTSPYGRIDHVLPSRGLEVLGAGVFLPAEGDPLRRLAVGEDRASDHLMVWVDVAASPSKTAAAPAGGAP